MMSENAGRPMLGGQLRMKFAAVLGVLVVALLGAVPGEGDRDSSAVAQLYSSVSIYPPRPLR